MTIALLTLVALTVGVARTEAQQPYRRWNLYEVEQMILGERGRVELPPELEAELPPFPPWPNRCYDLTVYLSNLVDSFTSRCLPLVKRKGGEIAHACVQEMAQSPLGAAQAIQGCVGQQLTAPAWAAEALQCTLGSVIGAANLSQQDAEGWVKMIQGVSDFVTLVGLANLFQQRLFLGIDELATPTSASEAQSFLRKAQAIGAREQQRLERLTLVPSQLESIVQAALTNPSLRRDQIDALSDAAVAHLDGCDPDGAATIYEAAKAEMSRHVAHMRTNLVLAESAYYCAAVKQDFDSMALVRQQEFLGRMNLEGRLQTGDRILRRQWLQAAAQHASALRAYRRLSDDLRLSDSNFADSRQRRERRAEQFAQLVARVDGCLAACGEGCTLPLETLEEAVHAERRSLCGRGDLAEEFGLHGRSFNLARAPAVRNSARLRAAIAQPKLRARLERCDLPAADSFLTELRREIVLGVPGAETRPECYRGTLERLEAEVARCRDVCTDGSSRRCSAFGVRVPALRRGLNQ